MSGHGSDSRYTHVATTRRKWSREVKRAIIAELDAPGASVSEVSRRHCIHTSLLFRWRREGDLHHAPAPAARSQPAAFLPMTVSAPMPPPPPPPLPPKSMSPPARIEIQLTNGRVVRIDSNVDADALVSIIAALECKA